MGGVEVEVGAGAEAEVKAEEKIIHYLKMPRLNTPQETMDIYHVLTFLRCLMSFLSGSFDLMESYLHAQGNIFLYISSSVWMAIFGGQCLN